jgi:hypothetical protein
MCTIPNERIVAVPLETDASYQCPSCFETNWVAVDPAGGRKQQFVEDCPVCCHPIVFIAQIDREGDAMIVSAESES